MLSAILLGFALGLRHAFDPDHTIAVSTIAARHRSPWTASWIGVSWGLGHAATLVAVGLAVIALRVAVPEALARSLELGVGLALVGLGSVNLLAATGRRGNGDAGAREGPPLRSTLARSGLVGLVHGLAGSGAVALIAVAAMPTPVTAIAYLFVFSAGTVVGMVAFSWVLGVPFALIGTAGAARRWLTAATGAVSLLVGTHLVYQIACARGMPLPAS